MKRGVSIATLTATITIILILVTTVTISASKMFDNVQKSNFATEISLIQKSVDSYLLKNENDYPILDSVIIDLNNVSTQSRSQFSNNGENVTDNKVGLFNIDYDKIGYTDLKYGNKKNGANDIYVLSGLTGKVYYAAGFKVGDKVYYTLTDELKKVLDNKKIDNISESNNDIISYSQENVGTSEKKVKIKIPEKYVVTSITAADYNYTSTNIDGYNVYEITAVPGTTIDIAYTYNGQAKVSSYTVKATVEKTEEGYAKDGLILHYDGINNTGNGHSSTTTVWKDLSGNGNDGTLTNFNNNATSGWSNNYLLFDGLDDYVKVLKTKSVDDLLENGNVTVEMTFKYVDVKSAFTFLVDLKRQPGDPGKALWIGTNQDKKLIVDSRPTAFFTSYVPSKDVDYCLTLKFEYNNSTTSRSMFINNKKIYEHLNYKSKIYNNTSRTIIIGGEDLSTYYNSNIKVYSVRIYNRALTEDEIKQNYEVDKKRFGI